MTKALFPAWTALLLLVCAAPVRAGHDNLVMDPAFKRYAAQVVALGKPDTQGRVYSFEVKRLPAAPDFARDELRGWRLTMLAGKRFSQAYEITGNTGNEVTVSTKGEPLDGVVVKDVLVIENAPLLPNNGVVPQQ
jgi:hypothetical protein